jgi:hypothetical protein
LRHPIETAPRDGKEIWVEDDQSAYDVAHWSSATKEWVWKNGRPIRITPTHWSPITEPQYQEDKQSSDPLQNERVRRWFIGSLIAATLALNGVYFRTELVAFATQHLDLRGIADLDIKLDLSSKPGDDAAQLSWPAEAATADLQRSLDKERARTASLTSELAQFRIDLETAIALSAESHDEAARRRQAAEALRQSLQQEQAGVTALSDELLRTRREIETQAMQFQKAVEETVQQKQTADAVASELRESLHREQEKTAALTQEIGTTRQAMTASAEQQRRALDGAEGRAAAIASELAETRQKIETQAAQSRSAVDEALQQQQTAEAATAKLRGSLQQEQEKTAALTQEVDAARQGATATAEQQRRALDEAQVRTAAFSRELTGTRSEIETQAAQSRKAVDEALQQKLTAEAATTKLRDSLQQEQRKVAALIQEVSAARQAMTASAEQQSRALNEAQTRAATLANQLAETRREMKGQSAQSKTADDASARQRQAAERTVAGPRQERDKTRAMTRDATLARRSADQREPLGGALDSPIARAVQTATRQPVASVAQDKAETARLIARAKGLLSQGNIGAARIVLERVVESGNAHASFMLAETYDPAILSAWGTYGTRGESAKARELYIRAHSGGIREAKERLDALRE